MDIYFSGVFFVLFLYTNQVGITYVLRLNAMIDHVRAVKRGPSVYLAIQVNNVLPFTWMRLPPCANGRSEWNDASGGDSIRDIGCCLLQHLFPTPWWFIPIRQTIHRHDILNILLTVWKSCIKRSHGSHRLRIGPLANSERRITKFYWSLILCISGTPNEEGNDHFFFAFHCWHPVNILSCDLNYPVQFACLRWSRYSGAFCYAFFSAVFHLLTMF